MRLVTFQESGRERLGALVLDGVLDLVRAGEGCGVVVPPSLQALIEAGPEVWDAVRALVEKQDGTALKRDVMLSAPLPRPVRLRARACSWRIWRPR